MVRFWRAAGVTACGMCKEKYRELGRPYMLRTYLIGSGKADQQKRRMLEGT